MGNVAIYVYSGQPLKDARGDLEDDIEDHFGEALEVTGGGAGQRGWNIDMELSDVADPEQVIHQLVAFLREWGVPDDTYLHIFPADWVEGQKPRHLDVHAK